MLLMDRDLRCALDEDGIHQSVTVLPCTEELARASFTPDKVEELMAYFDFTSPLLQIRDQVRHVVELPSHRKERDARIWMHLVQHLVNASDVSQICLSLLLGYHSTFVLDVFMAYLIVTTY
ncbi:unnamed protein product [Taenia asiatica]|uniref:Rab-GAP TBC domain-containing protein n=1 Tax=Taenia asiatica TaxID=60517 RepID=A0A158RAA4_TAEAS|nr:unnamed protein product [Taenia asiatica]